MAVRVKQPPQPDTRPPVVIKGSKDGLLFLLDDQCPFPDLMEYVTGLLADSGSELLTGTNVAVTIDYGSRSFSATETRRLMRAFLDRENFLMREWSSGTSARRKLSGAQPRTARQNLRKGTVRNGQSLLFDGDVVLIGDVNPGGELSASGDVYVFGRLHGTAHAGCTGNTAAIIAAAEFAPMQLRIAHVVSRSPESPAGGPLHTFMEFAYLRGDVMAVDRMIYRTALLEDSSE